MSTWIDTHCHLDAQEFWPLAHEFKQKSAINGVAICVLPAVEVANFAAVRTLAHQGGDAYALGIHPLCVAQASKDALAELEAALTTHQHDPRLVAVGEIGLDFFVHELTQPPLRDKQLHFFRQQLKLARQFELPVLLHSRRAVDAVTKALRDTPGPDGAAWHGIAHAFNGSLQQADTLIGMGLKLGFGGTMTFPRAQQLRRLATTLPLQAIVMETDAPDMPPHWIYKTAEQRAAGEPQGINSPQELPRIGQTLADLRGISVNDLATATTHNALTALPKLAGLM